MKNEKKVLILDGQVTDYSVTFDGKIFNNKTGREVKGTDKTNEYQSVILSINGKPKTCLVHRLIALMFCDNPNGYNIVDHIDRDKHNNIASNLRWASASENAKNAVRKEPKKKEYYKGSFDDKDSWAQCYENPDYMISKDGTMVVNKNTRYISANLERNGYYRVNLSNGIRSVHVLVWEAFNKQKKPSGYVIDHINGIRNDNRLENLRLVTQSENMKHSFELGREDQVKISQYSLKGEFIKTYPQIIDAAEAVGVTHPAIRSAAKRHGTCGGYYWIREDDPISIDEVINSWVPEGYKIIKEFPTYCINKDGEVYNKRNKAPTPTYFLKDGVTKGAILAGKKVRLNKILEELDFQ